MNPDQTGGYLSTLIAPRSKTITKIDCTNVMIGGCTISNCGNFGGSLSIVLHSSMLLHDRKQQPQFTFTIVFIGKLEKAISTAQILQL